MEVNENILHKPSILQEKVRGAGEVWAHPVLFIWFLNHSSALNIVSLLAIYRRLHCSCVAQIWRKQKHNRRVIDTKGVWRSCAETPQNHSSFLMRGEDWGGIKATQHLCLYPAYQSVHQGRTSTGEADFTPASAGRPDLFFFFFPLIKILSSFLMGNN